MPVERMAYGSVERLVENSPPWNHIKIIKGFDKPPFLVTTRANFTGVSAAPVVRV